MTYALLLDRSAAKYLSKLRDKNLKGRLEEAIKSLIHAPMPAGYKKLAGTVCTYRIRVGVYRIIYDIEQEKIIILVLAIGHRRDIYR